MRSPAAQPGDVLLNRLAELIAPAQFPPGAIIFPIGSRLRGALLVRSGQVRLTLPHPDALVPILFRVCGPGDVVSPGGLAPEPMHDCQAVAATAVSGFLLDEAALEHLVEAAPEVAVAVMSRLLGQTLAEAAVSAPAYFEHRLRSEPDPDDDRILAAGRCARDVLEQWDQPRIERLVDAVRRSVRTNLDRLAEHEVHDTGVGNVADKRHRLEWICDATTTELRTTGSLSGAVVHGLGQRASTRVVLAIPPAIHLVSSALVTVLTALESRDALVFAFPSALCALGDGLVSLVRDALREGGAPADTVQHIGPRAGRLRVARLLQRQEIDLVLATGATALVTAAYSSGRPAHAIGPGNVPVLISDDADVERAARQVVASKSHDFGISNDAESNLVVDRRVHDRFADALAREGAWIVTAPEAERVERAWFDPETGRIQRALIGQPVGRLAEAVGLQPRPHACIAVIPADGTQVGRLGRPKHAPVVAMYKEDPDGLLPRCRQLLACEGWGHTAVIHSRHPAAIERFARALPVARILVNSPASFASQESSGRRNLASVSLASPPVVDAMPRETRR